MKVRGIRKKQINKKFNQAIAGQPVFPAQMEATETEEDGKLAETFYKISDDYNTVIEFRLVKLLPVMRIILIILTGLTIVGIIGDWIFMPYYYP